MHMITWLIPMSDGFIESIQAEIRHVLGNIDFAELNSHKIDQLSAALKNFYSRLNQKRLQLTNHSPETIETYQELSKRLLDNIEKLESMAKVFHKHNYPVTTPSPPATSTRNINLNLVYTPPRHLNKKHIHDHSPTKITVNVQVSSPPSNNHRKASPSPINKIYPLRDVRPCDKVPPSSRSPVAFNSHSHIYNHQPIQTESHRVVTRMAPTISESSSDHVRISNCGWSTPSTRSHHNNNITVRPSLRNTRPTTTSALVASNRPTAVLSGSGSPISGSPTPARIQPSVIVQPQSGNNNTSRKVARTEPDPRIESETSSIGNSTANSNSTRSTIPPCNNTRNMSRMDLYRCLREAEELAMVIRRRLQMSDDVIATAPNNNNNTARILTVEEIFSNKSISSKSSSAAVRRDTTIDSEEVLKKISRYLKDKQDGSEAKEEEERSGQVLTIENKVECHLVGKNIVVSPEKVVTKAYVTRRCPSEDGSSKPPSSSHRSSKMAGAGGKMEDLKMMLEGRPRMNKRASLASIPSMVGNSEPFSPKFSQHGEETPWENINDEKQGEEGREGEGGAEGGGIYLSPRNLVELVRASWSPDKKKSSGDSAVVTAAAGASQVYYHRHHHCHTCCLGTGKCVVADNGTDNSDKAVVGVHEEDEVASRKSVNISSKLTPSLAKSSGASSTIARTSTNYNNNPASFNNTVVPPSYSTDQTDLDEFGCFSSFDGRGEESERVSLVGDKLRLYQQQVGNIKTPSLHANYSLHHHHHANDEDVKKPVVAPEDGMVYYIIPQ